MLASLYGDERRGNDGDERRGNSDERRGNSERDDRLVKAMTA